MSLFEIETPIMRFSYETREVARESHERLWRDFNEGGILASVSYWSPARVL